MRKKKSFVLIDGDDVGEKIDALIVKGDVVELLRFTRAVDRAVDRIAALVRKSGGAVHMAGGDNVLGQVGDVDGFLRTFMKARRAFCVTFSVGVGASAREAHVALKAAKGAGTGEIVGA